jgi:hypothetical protein
LFAGKFLQHLSSWEKKQIVKFSATHSWIKGDLFYTGPELIIRRCV